MKIKRLLALVLALTMIFSATAVLAADLDLTVKNPDGTTKTISSGIWPFKGAVTYDMNKNPENYQVEVSGKNYKVDDVKKELEKTENEGKPLSEIVADLTPVTPVLPPTEELKVEGINFNDAKTGFVVNFNRAVLAAEKATLKIVVSQGGTPVVGNEPVYADDKKSATVDFGKALSGKYTVKVTGIKTEKTEELEVPSTETMFTLKAKDTKTLQVEFKTAVSTVDQSNVQFIVAKDAVKFDVMYNQKWATDGKSVELGYDIKLPVGKYTVTVKDITGYPAEGNKSNEIEVKAQKIEKIEITNKYLEMGKDNTINVKAFDQYGEVELKADKFTFRAYNVTKDMVVKFDTTTTNKIDVTEIEKQNKGDKIRINVVLNADDSIKAEANLELKKVAIDHVEFGDIEIPEGAKRIYINTKGISIPIKAFDLEGKDYPLEDGAVAANSFALTWTLKDIINPTIKGGKLMFDVAAANDNAKIEVYAPTNDKTAKKTFKVEDKPMVKTLKVYTPEMMYPNAEYSFTLEAKDQYGDDMLLKKGETFATYFGASTPAITVTSGQPAIVDGAKFSADNTMKIKTKSATNIAAAVGDHTLSIKTLTPATELLGTTGQKFTITANPKVTGLVVDGISADTGKTKLAVGGKLAVTIKILGKDSTAGATERELTAAELKRLDSTNTLSVTVSGGGSAFEAPYPTTTAVKLSDAAGMKKFTELVGKTAGAEATITFALSSAGTTPLVKKATVIAAPTKVSVEINNLTEDKIAYNTDINMTVKATDGTTVNELYNAETKATFGFGNLNATSTVTRNVKFTNGVMEIIGNNPVKAIWSGENQLWINIEGIDKTSTVATGKSKAFSIVGNKPVKFIVAIDKSNTKLILTAVDATGNPVSSFDGKKFVKVLVDDNKTDLGNGDSAIEFDFQKSGISKETEVSTVPLSKDSVIKVEYTDAENVKTTGTFTIPTEPTKKKYDVTMDATSTTIKIDGIPSAIDGEACTIKLVADEHYEVPATLVAGNIKVKGTALSAGVTYTQSTDKSIGTIVIAKAQVTGDIEITAAGVSKSYAVTLSTDSKGVTLTGTTAEYDTTTTTQRAVTIAKENANYALPATIEVKIGGTPLTSVTDYNYNQTSGLIQFENKKVTGAVEIKAVSTVTVTWTKGTNETAKTSINGTAWADLTSGTAGDAISSDVNNIYIHLTPSSGKKVKIAAGAFKIAGTTVATAAGVKIGEGADAATAAAAAAAAASYNDEDKESSTTDKHLVIIIPKDAITGNIILTTSES